MPCYHPLTGYRSKFVNSKTGKRGIVFNASDGFKDMPVTVPCGRCTGCRLEYSRQWAMRCVHEAQMHQANSFITLTYAPEHLPKDHSIHKLEVTNFFKNLRRELEEIYGKTLLETPTKRIKYEPNKPIRYFACGEYGEVCQYCGQSKPVHENDKNCTVWKPVLGRPHYHAIIFGFDFPDRILWKKTKTGELLYRSKLLEKVWKKGHSSIGNVTFESAAYVSRYVMKKRKGKPDQQDSNGKKNYEFYQKVDPETGEIYQCEQEFCLMSRNPGLGNKWMEKYHSDTNKDFLTLRGKKMKLPKYYDSILEAENEIEFELRKLNRRKKAEQFKEDNTYERLLVKEKVKKAQLNQLIRNLDE